MTDTHPLLALLFILGLGVSPLVGCPSANDDDSAGDDDDATSDDDDATSDDDDATGDDDDATGDDDDSSGDDDDSSAGDDDDDATGDDDDSAGDDDDSAAGCGIADLTTSFEVRVGGVAGTTFGPTDDLVFAGIASNPCDIPLTVTSISTCLVGSWSATPSGGGIGIGVGTACGDAPTPFLIPAGASIEETVVFGPLSVGSWSGEANFDVPSLAVGTGSFTVQ